jgi:tRNA (adenine37-N6)-methyltransferase
MPDNLLTLRPIGFVRSAHTRASATPIQPAFAEGCAGRVEMLPEFAEGLIDIEGFSHAYIIYWLHQSTTAPMRVKPFLQDKEHGVFATRSPNRPNPIGLSLVRVIARESGVLVFDGADMLDGTPVLDIKPYAPCFDKAENPRGGWTDEVPPDEAQRRGARHLNQS